MKMMPAPCFRACSNRSRTRAAPTPTNISTNSEPEIEKKLTSASPATARASSVLPVPGGPTSRTPLGMRAPSRLYAFGSRRKSTISFSSVLRLFHAGDIGKRHLGVLLDVDLRAALADGHKPAAQPRCPKRRMTNIQSPKNSSVGSTQDRISGSQVFGTSPK